MQRFNKKYLYLTVGLVFLIIAHYLNFTDPLEKVVSGSLGSLFSSSRAVLVGKDASNLSSISSLKWQTEATRLQTENDELKKLLTFRSRTSYETVTTKVVARDSVSAEQVLVLDAGSEDRLAVGQPVVVLDGIMVGKIIKVNESQAWLRLLNDGNSQVAASILNRDKSIGVVEGGYGLSVKMNFIPRNETVVVGDMVITSGWEKSVPAGLVLGQVVAVENESYKPFQQAVISPPASLEKITVVSVLVAKQ